jgi:putative DNA primase/helicase
MPAKLSDFNDLHAAKGKEAVRSAILASQSVSLPEEGEWPDPMIPGAMPSPEIPAALLPSWVGDMALAVADSTQTPPAMAVMLALSVLATVVQRRWEVFGLNHVATNEGTLLRPGNQRDDGLPPERAGHADAQH